MQPAENNSKRCPKCGEIKSIDEFFMRSRRNVKGDKLPKLDYRCWDFCLVAIIFRLRRKTARN